MNFITFPNWQKGEKCCYINKDHIVAVSVNNDNHDYTSLLLSNTELYEIHLPLKEVLNIIETL